MCRLYHKIRHVLIGLSISSPPQFPFLQQPQQRQAVVQNAAAASPVPAGQWRMSRSGSVLPYCRRDCRNLAARPVFAAAFCGAKGANRWRYPVYPPCIAAAIVQFSPLSTRFVTFRPSLSTLYSALSTHHFLSPPTSIARLNRRRLPHSKAASTNQITSPTSNVVPTSRYTTPPTWATSRRITGSTNRPVAW